MHLRHVRIESSAAAATDASAPNGRILGSGVPYRCRIWEHVTDASGGDHFSRHLPAVASGTADDAPGLLISRHLNQDEYDLTYGHLY